MRRVDQPIPLVREAFPTIRAIYELLHEEHGVTYADIGRAMGYSGSRIKQVVKGYVAVKSPSGGWTVGKPPAPPEAELAEEEETVALASQGSGTGEEGSAPTGCLPGAEG